MNRQAMQVVRYPANDFIHVGTPAGNGCWSASDASIIQQ
jgi:hypothetical protein